MAARSASWFLPPTRDPLGVIVVHVERDNPAHPGLGHRLLGGWTASARVADKAYVARSFTGPVHRLARHLAEIGIADAPLLVRTSGQGETRHPSFHALAGRG